MVTGIGIDLDLEDHWPWPWTRKPVWPWPCTCCLTAHPCLELEAPGSSNRRTSCSHANVCLVACLEPAQRLASHEHHVQ